MNAPLHWPFGSLTPHQLRHREAQEQAMRENRLARWPGAVVACAIVAGALAGCGGGEADDEPDVPPPRPVDCHVKPEACK